MKGLLKERLTIQRVLKDGDVVEILRSLWAAEAADRYENIFLQTDKRKVDTKMTTVNSK